MTVLPVRRPMPRRVAMLSVHTSPLDQPGTGDAGGMNVYVVELSRRLAALGVEVGSDHPGDQLATSPPVVELEPGVTVRHVTAGPFEGLAKEDLPAQLCAFTSGVHAHRGDPRARAGTTWSTPTTGCPARSAGWPRSAGACRSCTPCTPWPRSRTSRSPTATHPSRSPARSARPRSSRRPTGSSPTPTRRRASSSSSTTPTRHRVVTVAPGRRPRPLRSRQRRAAARARLGLPAGRRRAAVRRPDPAAEGARRAAPRGRADARRRPRAAPTARRRGGRRAVRLRARAPRARCRRLAAELGVADVVRFEPPVPADALPDWYRAADLTVVPSYSESFGLVAIESQACGTPVVAAVGGRPADGRARRACPACWSTATTRPTTPR